MPNKAGGLLPGLLVARQGAHEIAHRDQAHDLLAVDHQQMTEVTVHHLLYSLLERVGSRKEDNYNSSSQFCPTRSFPKLWCSSSSMSLKPCSS